MPSSLISWPEYLPNRMRLPGCDIQRDARAFLGHSAVADGEHLPLLGFSLAESGMMMPPICCSPSSRR